MLQRFSYLDLSPVPEGGTVGDALRNTVDLARQAEAQGFHRYWLAEHHNMPGIASSATAVMIGQVAAATATIRVGAGGVMLPNHAPLMVAEQFGTLASLYPDRIDLGLGRAPGTDMKTMRALRRHMDGSNDFPQEVVELLSYLEPAALHAPVKAIPGQGTRVPVWILGSSLGGAQVAAHFGLPYAVASHFAPQMIDEALHVYRTTFRPSDTLAKPYAMVAAGLYVAETDDAAHFLRSSHMLGYARLRMGRPGKLPYPVRDLSRELPEGVLSAISEDLSFAAVGSPDTVRAQLADIIARTQPDELILTSAIHDHGARIRSNAMGAEILKDLCHV